MKVHILHTNDLHSHLEHWDLLAAYIKQRRLEIQSQGDLMVLCDIGDAIDFSQPLVEATSGQVIVDLFNQVEYDVVTMGNNEGLNITPQKFNRLIQTANYSVVCGNLNARREEDQVEHIHKLVIKDLGGRRIAFLGLTAPYPSYALNDYHVLDPYQVLDQQLKELDKRQEEWDYIVLLSHLGYPFDREIARRYPDIDIILGGHTHHLLKAGERIEGVSLAACGRYGEYIGEVVLDVKNDHPKISTKSLADLKSLDLQISLTDYQSQGRKLLDQDAIAWLPQAWDHLSLSESDSFMEHSLDIFCRQMGCPLAMLSTGMLLNDLPQGELTANDLHQALPHPLHLVRLDLLGQDLRAALDEISSQGDQLMDRPVSGSGFRGKQFGKMVMRGITYDSKIKQWRIEGQAIEDHQIYQIVTLDHYLMIPFFPSLKKYQAIKVLFPNFLRQVMRDYLQDHYPLK